MAITQELIYKITVVGTDSATLSTQELIAQQKELQQLLKDLPEEGTEAYDELDQAIQQTTGNTETLASTQANLTNQFAQSRQRIQDFNRELRRGTAAAGSINDIRQRLISVRRELDNTAQTVDGRTNPAFERLSRESAELNQELIEAEAASGRFQRNVGNYPEIGNNITATFKQVGATLLAAFAVTAIVNKAKQAISQLITTGVDFARIRSTLLALNEGTNIDVLIDDAKRLGSATEFTASQVGGLQIVLTKLGFNQQEILDATEATLNLATVTGEDLAQAGEVAAKTLRAFGLDSTQLVRVTDVMAKSFVRSALDLTKFRESMKTIAPIAKQLGFSIEDTTAFLAALTDAGIEGSMAGTALRSVFLKLADPTSELSLRLGDGVDSGEKLVAGLRELQDSGTDLAEILAITDVRSAAAFATILDGSDKVERLSKEFNNAAGSAANMAAIVRDDVRGDLDTATSAVEGLALNIFDSLEPAIRLVVQGFTGFISLLSGAVDLVQRFPVLFGAIAAALGTYTAALIANRVATKLAVVQQVLYNGVMLLVGPLLSAASIATSLYIVATNLLTGTIGLATAAQQAWNVVLSVNPIVRVSIAVGALVGAVIALTSGTNRLTEAQKRQLELEEDLAKAIAQETVESEKLFRVAKDETLSRKERTEAIDEINKSYKQYLPNLLTEESSLEDIAKAQNAVNAALIQKIALQVREQQITASITRAIEDQQIASQELIRRTGISASQLRKVNEELSGFLRDTSDEQRQAILDSFSDIDSGLEVFVGRIAGGGGLSETVSNALNVIAEGGAEASVALVDLVGATVVLNDEVRDINDFFINNPSIPESIVGDGDGGVIDDTRKKLEDLRKEVAQFKKDQELTRTREEYDALQVKIDETEKLIRKITGASAKSIKSHESAVKALDKRIIKLNAAIAKEIELADAEAAGGEKSIEGLEVLRNQALERLDIRLAGFESERQALIKAGIDEDTLLQVTAEQRVSLIESINKEFDDKIAQATEKSTQDRIAREQKALEEVLDARLLQVQQNRLNEISLILEGDEEELANLEQLEEDKKLIEEKADQDRLDAQLDFINDQLAILELSAEDTLKLEQERLEILNNIKDLELDKVREVEEKKREEIKKSLEAQKQALDGFVSIVSSIKGVVEDQANTEINNLKRTQEQREQTSSDNLAAIEEEFEARALDIESKGFSTDEEKRLLDELALRKEKEIEEEKARSESEIKILQDQQKTQELIQKKAQLAEQKAQAIQSILDNATIARNNIVTLSNNLKAISEGAKIPFPANIAAIISIIAAIAAGIVSARKLTQSVSLESGGDTALLFAGGGDVPTKRYPARTRRKGYGGMHRGPRHSQGGIPIEVEGGEFEHNRWATELFYPLLQWTNHQGILRKQGRPFGDMSTLFGMVKSVGSNSMVNIPRVPVRAPKYRFQTGGAVTGVGGATNIVFQELAEGFEGLTREIAGVRDDLQTIDKSVQNQELVFSLIEQRKQEANLVRQETKSEL